MDPNKTVSSANEILPGLWLGNEAASQDASFMQAHNITVIVNATKHIPCKFKMRGIKYWRVPVNDPGPLPGGHSLLQDDIQTMIKYLPETIKFIHAHHNAGQKILIHCHAGAQRSAIIMAAYVVTYGKWNINSTNNPHTIKKIKKRLAIKHIIQRRPQAFFGGTSVNFKPALDFYLGIYNP